jgi:hypothetical protein
MMMTIQSQVGTLVLSLEAWRLYAELSRICNCRSQSGTVAEGALPPVAGKQ